MKLITSALTALALTTSLAPSALAAVDMAELPGAMIPVPVGAKLQTPGGTLESGAVTFDAKDVAVYVMWSPEANLVVDQGVLDAYAPVLESNMGIKIDAAAATFGTIAGHPMGRLPVKMADDVPQGRGLIWGCPTSGRVFFYFVAPKRDKLPMSAVDVLLDEVVAAMSCHGHGKARPQVVVLDELGPGWGEDLRDLPRVQYKRFDNRQWMVMWRSDWDPDQAKGYDCKAPAQQMFDRYTEGQSWTLAGEPKVLSSPDKQRVPGLLCEVEAPVDGWTAEEGDRVVFSQWLCEGAQDTQALAVTLYGGGLGEDAVVPYESSSCRDFDADEHRALRNPVFQGSDSDSGQEQEKKQWMPQ